MSDADDVTSALEHYATRGVFRGFSVHPRRGGRLEYRFLWLTPRPMVVVYDGSTRTLTFRNVLPGLGTMKEVLAAVKEMVGSRSSRDLPAHKRLDRRKANVSCFVRGGDCSVAMTTRGAHQEYAVRMALNLINEIFVLLHETYPDYLTEQFGLAIE